MSIATAGGALRDWNGDWLGGFSVQLGTCSEFEAEPWAALHGLRLAWEQGIRRHLELEHQTPSSSATC